MAAWWAQLRTGWGFVGRRPALWGLFLGLGMTNAYFSVFGAIVLPRVGERLLEVWKRKGYETPLL